ncbi:universal stress protein [Granulosicoccaceae sp. 1_MG-2023]|nr:universal stress protein [Granulosicoccaceae sp. 1_MG-2023]
MTLKNILVAYNGNESSDAALATALLLQSRHDAHVTGLLVHGPSAMTRNLKPWMPPDVVDTVSELEERSYDGIRERFYQLASQHTDAERIHWLQTGGETDRTVSHYAQYFDLTVVGRLEALQEDLHLQLHPEQIALYSGRPVLAVPRKFSINRFNNSALIAWDGKSAAARAMFEALPLLHGRQTVTILTIADENTPPPPDGVTPSLALQRHGIEAKDVLLVREGRTSVESLLARFVTEQQPGLLIMGAYQRRKTLGRQAPSLADNVLAGSRIPVFISYRR